MFRRYMFLPALFVVLLLSGSLAWADSYRDGVYPGSARDGVFEVELKVAIAGGRVRDIEYLAVPAWEADTVKSALRRRIIEKQSPEVDGVTRATVSSNLIKKAVADALARARVTPSPRPAFSPPAAAGGSVFPRVVLQTARGEIEVELFPDKAPLAVENFLGLVRKGYYDGVVFHRVVPDFMIQGGDPSGFGWGGKSIWGKTFKDEFSPDLRFDKAGLLAMANSGPDTNGSQFFITVAPTPHLNDRHTIFGRVVGGYDVVEKLSRVPTGRLNRPLEKQMLIKARVKSGE